MKRTLGVVLVVLIVIGGVLWRRWKNDEPRRVSLAAVEKLDAALQSGNSREVIEMLVIPQAIQGRTTAEQTEFLFKALRDAISSEGLAMLRKKGEFGVLHKVFPAEGDAWAKQVGAHSDECVAFKMERNGLRAEVVLLTNAPAVKIIRINNVKQMAGTS